VHENVTLTGPTRAAHYMDEKPSGPLMLQGDHGPVAYRNIKIMPIDLNAFFAMDTGTKDEAHQSAESQVQMVKDLGYDGIDHLGYDGIEDKLNAVDKLNMRLFAIYLGAYIDKDREPYDARMQEIINLLQNRETVIWLPLRSETYSVSDPAGDEEAVRTIQKLADKADRAKLNIVLYPHTNFWLEKVSDAIRVMKKVNRKNVGMTFNLCHWLRTGNSQDLGRLLSEAMPYLSMVSINGADRDGKDWKTLIQTLDNGSYPVLDFLKALKQFGYSGPIALQGYGIGGDVHQNLKRSKGAWDEMVDELMDLVE
jgi:sugar phosphate isomerase/epimerase